MRLRAGMSTDMGTLIGWFANAIQTGVDSVRNEGVVRDFIAGSAADELAQAEAALANAAQDYTKGVAGAGPCMDYLRLGLPRGPLRRDSIRQAFLAGYDVARKEAAPFRQVADPAPGQARSASPYPDTAAFLARLAQVNPPMGGVLPPGYFVAGGVPTGQPEAYLQAIAGIVGAEVRRRVTEYAAREPARIQITEVPAMVNVLRMAGYVVMSPDEAERARKDRLAPPVVELAHAPDNGVRLLLDGAEEVHCNDGDSGGAGLTLGVRALAGKLGIEVIEP